MTIPWPKPAPRCSWRTCRALATHYVTAGHPCTCWPGKKGCRCPGYADTPTCERHIGQVAARNTRIAAQPAVVRELDQPLQPVLDLGGPT